MKGDFHIHTKASDGFLTIEEIFNYIEGKIDYISITDHDTITDSVKASISANDYSFKSIIGVEVTSFYNNESIHILGYFKPSEDFESLEIELKDVRDNRFKRALKICELLKLHFNIELDFNKFLEFKSISRGTIAREIIKQGVYSNDYIFDNILGKDSPAYVSLDKLDPKTAISLIKKYNGTAILAHPTLIKGDYKEIALWCDGLEAIYPLNKSDEQEDFMKFASENNLLITAGSDFHNFRDKSHGQLLSYFLEGEYLDRFLKKVLS